jgi:hypothetical protein
MAKGKLPPFLEAMMEGSYDEDSAEAQDGFGSLSLGAKAELLKQEFENYAAGCPFKPGDLITPRKHHNLKGAGQPHVVLAVVERKPLQDILSDQIAQNPNMTMARAPDMRVLNIAGGQVVSFWEESFNYEPYTGPVGLVTTLKSIKNDDKKH